MWYVPHTQSLMLLSEILGNSCMCVIYNMRHTYIWLRHTHIWYVPHTQSLMLLNEILGNSCMCVIHNMRHTYIYDTYHTHSHWCYWVKYWTSRVCVWYKHVTHKYMIHITHTVTNAMEWNTGQLVQTVALSRDGSAFPFASLLAERHGTGHEPCATGDRYACVYRCIHRFIFIYVCVYIPCVNTREAGVVLRSHHYSLSDRGQGMHRVQQVINMRVYITVYICSYSYMCLRITCMHICNAGVVSASHLHSPRDMG